MISIASFMSSSSITNSNAYLNSNAINRKNISKAKAKTWNINSNFNDQDDDGENDFAFEENTQDNALDFGELKFEGERNFVDMSESDVEENDGGIDYCINFNANHKEKENFQNKANNSETTIIDQTIHSDFQTNFLKMFDQTNQTNNQTSQSNETGNNQKLSHDKSISNKENRNEFSTNNSLSTVNKHSSNESNSPKKTQTKTNMPFVTIKSSPTSSSNNNISNSSSRSTTITTPSNLSSNKLNQIEQSNSYVNSSSILSKEVNSGSSPSSSVTETNKAKEESKFAKINSQTKENQDTTTKKPPSTLKLDSNETSPSSTSSTSTASKDLLDWCRLVVSEATKTHNIFNSLDIKDFSSSWKNGLGFCAIIYKHKPNLIELKHLSLTEIKNNLKQAFSASDSLNVVRVLDYSDFLNKEHLDQLLIMTYLYQLRDHFETSKSGQHHSQLSPSSNIESKYKNLLFSPIKLPTKLFTDSSSNSKSSSSTLPESQTGAKKFSIVTVVSGKGNYISKVPESFSKESKSSASCKKDNKNNYLNPFDSDEEGKVPVDLKSTSAKTKSGIIQIKPNGIFFLSIYLIKFFIFFLF
jgi:hypothetical protein